jgi:PHP family Zn ribbon phosphoesterase
LLPLSEIIATVFGSDSPSTQAIWKNYNLLTEKFGDEYSVLIDAPLEALIQVVEEPIAQAIVNVRTGSAKVTPGYDGVYGQLVLGIDPPLKISLKPKLIQPIVKQKSMTDFW